ncbi:MAG: endopeptidase La [Alphaproteobacteria bacterium]
MAKQSTSKALYAVLPLRDIVMFPGMVAPLFVGRDKSVKALENVISDNKNIVLITQKDANNDSPLKEDIFQIGVLGHILQLLKLPDGTVKVLVEARKRIRIKKFIDNGSFFEAEIDELKESEGDSVETEILMRTVLEEFEEYAKLNKRINQDIISSLVAIKDPGQLADIIASHLFLKIPEKQSILEVLSINKRLERILSLIQGEIGVLNTEQKIRRRVKKQMEKTQKEYYLNEQLKAIQNELGGDDSKSDINEYETKINKVKLSKEAKEKAQSELKKLKSMNSLAGGEATIVRNYLDTLLALPWGVNNNTKSNIKEAKKILDDDHYGMDKVKERILEYLAVQQRIKKLKGPILCLVGPPGVGKTSLAKSIADATGREFVRFSLGGVRDEAEVRGHRRTYIGAMPGKIIQSLKKCKSSNPVFLLDEIDKIGADYRGDPASALLEVLDPAQNSKFVDHFLEVEYDLSDVMFVATANTLRMPRPLLDRMEIIRLSGYTEEEKIEIAERHLVPKQKSEHGLEEKEWSISETAIRDLIHYYTREAGVRNLEREIANLTRKAIKEILEGKSKTVKVTPKNLPNYAGVRKFIYGEAELEDLVGVTTGLAYTEVGGELLLIEAVSLPGKGDAKTTGKLGDVMQESAQAAFSYFRSKCVEYGVTSAEYQKKDIHIHVPEGATPKDGPSAGIAMFTTIVSIMTGIPVKKTVAMTGEITLRGRVLGIGGLKEKLLAALRGGIKTAIIPSENVKDLAEIPDNVKKGLKIIPVSSADEVIKIALVDVPKKLDLKVEIENLAQVNTPKKTDEISTH